MYQEELYKNPFYKYLIDSGEWHVIKAFGTVSCIRKLTYLSEGNKNVDEIVNPTDD